MKTCKHHIFSVNTTASCCEPFVPEDTSGLLARTSCLLSGQRKFNQEGPKCQMLLCKTKKKTSLSLRWKTIQNICMLENRKRFSTSLLTAHASSSAISQCGTLMSLSAKRSSWAFENGKRVRAIPCILWSNFLRWFHHWPLRSGRDISFPRENRAGRRLEQMLL